jgi:hypothetical protein
MKKLVTHTPDDGMAIPKWNKMHTSCNQLVQTVKYSD